MTAQPTPESIQVAVRQKYRQVAKSAAGKFKYPIGHEGALALGYAQADLAAAPTAMLAAFCGVGNPLSRAELKTGQTVLDVGCGAGLDLLIASHRVTPGHVYGVDLTREMVAAASKNLAVASATKTAPPDTLRNQHVLQAAVEQLPFASASFDVVISNGVLNLSPHKEDTFREIHRVLRPGGQLHFADIVRDRTLPPEIAGSLSAWSD
jgi:SAM-dependent methyltransferase